MAKAGSIAPPGLAFSLEASIAERKEQAMTWTNNVTIPNQKSKAAPALAMFNGHLHMVHLGDSSNNIWHSIFDGSSWSPNVTIPNQKSKTTPALAAFNGHLHMVHLGDSSNNIWHSIFDGSSWSPNVTIPNQKSKTTPALAAFNGHLHMVHLGDSSNNIWHSIFDGMSWSQNVTIPNQKSKTAPALAAVDKRLHMVHLGDNSNNIWHSIYDGTSWSPNVTIPNQQSKATPTLAVFNKRLHIAHLGDSSNNIWYAQLINASRWTANVRVPNQQSQTFPAIAALGNRLYMVHIGNTSHNIWHSNFTGDMSVVRIGAMILTDVSGNGVITQATFNNWLGAMRDVYGTMGFTVQLVGSQPQNLNLPNLLVVDVGDCIRGYTSSDQDTLFQNRNNLGANDIAVYFVNSTVPAYNGCATHPAGVPGCVVVATATQWTMAHECGHVLDLGHVNDNDRLMTSNGTANITNPPPDLTYSEGVTIGKSAYSIE
jgi:hypothetical protein